MTRKRRFISWQPVLTDHQAFTFQALAREAGTDVVAYVTSTEDPMRKAQGWTDTQVTSVQRRLIPTRDALGYCYRQLQEHKEDVHLFASPFAQPRLIVCLLLATLVGVEFYLISESYSPTKDGYLREGSHLLGKFKSLMRPWIYYGYALILRNRVSGIFAISQLAMNQYREAGIPPDKLFPFGYFIPSAFIAGCGDGLSIQMESSKLRIIFVGSLIRTKGVDLLVAAVKQLTAQGYALCLDIYGPGDWNAIRPDVASIRYQGIIPFGKSQQVIAQYDVLVLPSRYDGWGVVVNEALCAGVPVVCSDTVGAGVVAVGLGAGLSFSSGNSNSLADVLARIASDPALLRNMREAAPKAAGFLQPVVAARYMLDIIRAAADCKAAIPVPWSQKGISA